jgi:hypothetical protein
MPDSVPPSDRRVGERYFACYPASLIRPDGAQRLSLIHDLSVSGALLLVHTTKLNVGDEVKLELHIAEDWTKFRAVAGRVVRIQKTGPMDSGPWLRRVAVEFDEPLKMAEAEIESFKEQARRLGRGSNGEP